MLRAFLIFLSFFSVILLYNLIINISPSDNFYDSNVDKIESIEEINLNENQEKVFFVESQNRVDHDLKLRQACSIESAGRLSDFTKFIRYSFFNFFFT